MSNYSDMLSTLIDLGMGDWHEVPYDADIPAGVTYAEVYAPLNIVSQVRMVPNGSGLPVEERATPGQGYTYWSPVLIESPIDWQRWVDEAKRSGCVVEIGGVSIHPIPETQFPVLPCSVKDMYNAGA